MNWDKVARRASVAAGFAIGTSLYAGGITAYVYLLLAIVAAGALAIVWAFVRGIAAALE